MFSVIHGFVQEAGHVIVVQGVHGASTRALSSHQSEGAKKSELVRHR